MIKFSNQQGIICEAKGLLRLMALVYLVTSLHPLHAESVGDLRKELRTALLKMNEPKAKLRAQYVETLVAMLSQALADTDAKLAESINRELDTCQDTKTEHLFPDYPKLQKLRNFYVKHMIVLDKDLQKLQSTILQIYQDRYQQLQTSYIKAGQTQEEVAVSRELKRLQAALKNRDHLGELLTLWRLETIADVVLENNTGIQRKGKGYQIASKAKAGGKVRSSERFKTPYEIRLRAATDSTNIRFYIDRRVLTIFNWEVNPSELRVHDPTPQTNTKIPVRGKGYLEPDEMHDIRIRVEPNRITIMANGEVRYIFERDFSTLEGDVAIGPAFGSVLTVERFEVVPLLGF